MTLFRIFRFPKLGTAPENLVAFHGDAVMAAGGSCIFFILVAQQMYEIFNWVVVVEGDASSLGFCPVRLGHYCQRILSHVLDIFEHDTRKYLP